MASAIYRSGGFCHRPRGLGRRTCPLVQSPLTSVNQKMKGVPFRNNPPATHTHRDQAGVCFVTTSVTVLVLNIHVQGLTLPPSKAPGQTCLLFGGWIWGDCNRARGWSTQMLNPRLPVTGTPLSSCGCFCSRSPTSEPPGTGLDDRDSCPLSILCLFSLWGEES